MMVSLWMKICTVPTGWILLFVSIHSNEERGNLFIQQEDSTGKSVVVDVEIIFDLLLGNDMGNVVRGATLVLLTCSWVVVYKALFKALQSSLKW
ncbi:hypothetical protein PAXINDRAFT_16384 [Paxillus involutus ATCC 200175]|uniref:Uncharacterized protein n=1 Tax=Paxillus involutus ATCC 200175 TaxID=664439 RepID=A0A0C9TTT5_PAXIN|nr:hypothetical protein PAXINDRAFT_16384 [Paxillus involutus ATCC 200175]